MSPEFTDLFETIRQMAASPFLYGLKHSEMARLAIPGWMGPALWLLVGILAVKSFGPLAGLIMRKRSS